MSARSLVPALLKEVSRSFYLTLRVLPSTIRAQVSLAYLLARSTDSVADTTLLPVERRCAALQRMRKCILSPGPDPPDFREFVALQTRSPEAELLCRFPEAVRRLEAFEAGDRSLIRALLSTIISGQELDLERFASAGSSEIRALNSDLELDDYTYRVAGCVGEFWTKMCMAHLFEPEYRQNESLILEQAVRFGKGLQLVNILRDLREDLGRGRCYLPSDRLRAAGLVPSEFLKESSKQGFQSVIDIYIALALDHLRAGWEYTEALPRSQLRVRLACAWPILLGVKTLSRLSKAGGLGKSFHLKVPRYEVYALIARTVVLHPWPKAWHLLFAKSANS